MTAFQGPAAAGQERSAIVEPSRSAYVNARQVYLWSDGAIYHAYAQPGMITDIVLQAGENLIAVAAGDTARWIIGDTTSGNGDARSTHVLVKPFSAGLSTNLVITTDRRTYHLQLTSRTGAGMAALAWNYPLDELLAMKRAQDAEKAARPVAAGLPLENLYFGYTITGAAPAWRPLRAFDDGRQTFIEFPASIGVGEAPPLFLVGSDGSAELVNYRMQGRFYVVDRIFSVAELRFGARKQQVVRITRGPVRKGRS
ncbi:P-type conjugative transfer protein TrbG [Novosphingobium resinovorum]|uniref:P-type conjugative transfer protein TrbG n=1 Tax=Novosphingobium resinovorum TaxID=158500 RepID=A0A1D8A8V4_9SPHN|nr:P-type conjugative transfer protein TrbG [Novosphingobium resinovorum]